MNNIEFRWEVHKSDIPLHSVIREYNNFSLGYDYIETEPVPDVLVDEILHEMKQSKEYVAKKTLENILKIFDK